MAFYFRLIDPEALLPSYAHTHDAGMDIYSFESFLLGPNEQHMFSTGVSIQLLPGYEGQIRGRSSMNNKGIWVAGGIGTIDAGYKDEIKIILRNMTNTPYLVQKEDRIAQLIIAAVVFEPKYLRSQSNKRNGGFGSSGV